MIPNSDWRVALTDNYLPHRIDQWLVQWVNSRPEANFITLWDETIDPTWLPYFAEAGGATPQQIILAACGVARLCLPLIPAGEDRPRIAIETAEAWCRGEAIQEEQLSKVKTDTPLAASLYYSHTASLRSSYYAAYTAHYVVCAVCTPSQCCTYIYCAISDALRAGIESQMICATFRKYLPFERTPKPKGLTLWQRLAVEDTK